MLEVALDVTPGWPAGDWQARAERAVEIAVAHSRHAALGSALPVVEVSVRLADDAEVQALNRDYRGKDKPTNVLSFPQLDEAAIEAAAMGSADGPELLLGDIILGLETCAAEAAGRRIALGDHVSHLIVHGSLHLLGYDHIDDDEADAMEAIERQALDAIGIADPYAPVEDD